jgi:NADH dehydrogenase
VWLFVHIMKLVGFRNRVMVLIQWAGAYISYQRSVRLITGRDAARSVTSHVDRQRSAIPH